MNPTGTNHWEFGGPLAGLPPDQAWLILLTAVGLCAVLAWLSYRFAVVVLSLPQRALLVALRTIFLGALLLCLANPVQIERKTAEPPPPPPVAPPAGPTGRLAVLIDRSDSMTTADNRGRTRLDDALATWRRFEPVARPVYAETQYSSFAVDLKAAASLAEAITRTGGTTETHLYESITALLKKPKEERPNAIVVLTDGVDTSGEPEAMVRDAALAAGVPVHFVAGTNRDRPEPFLRVREWSAPSTVLRDTEFVVEASFEAFSREDRTVPYSLWWGDVRVESDTLTLTTGPNLVARSFRISAGIPGPLELSLRFGEGPTSQVAARSEISVLPGQKITVVVFQGALDWGLRYFTDALRTDPNFELLTVVNPALGVILARGAKPGSAVVGKLADDAAAHVGQAALLHDQGHAFARAPPAQALEPGAEFQIFAHPHLRIERVVFGHVPNAPAHFLGVVEDIEARHAHGPAIGRHGTGQHAHRGALARPVGAQQTHDLPPGHRERDVVHRRPAREALRQVGYFNHQVWEP